MSDARLGCGSILEYGDTANYATAVTWVAFNEVLSMDLPNAEAALVEVTNMSSPGCSREYIGGLQDGGSVNISLNWTAAEWEVIYGKVKDTVAFRMTINDSIYGGVDTVVRYNAVVQTVSGTITAADVITYSITLKLTGEIDIAAGSGS